MESDKIGIFERDRVLIDWNKEKVLNFYFWLEIKLVLDDEVWVY